MIVRRCFKRIDQKHFNNKNTEPDTFTHNGSKKQSMVDDSSISTFSNDETKNTNDEKKNEERQKSRSMRFVGRLANEGGISGTAKKRLF